MDVFGVRAMPDVSVAAFQPKSTAPLRMFQVMLALPTPLNKVVLVAPRMV